MAHPWMTFWLLICAIEALPTFKIVWRSRPKTEVTK